MPTRRQMLAAAAALAVLPPAARAADTLAGATITPQGATVTGKRVRGPWRIGFSNGYSGNAWRQMCVAALKQEAALRRDTIAELIVVDGHGDVARQAGDVAALAAQHVDAILCIPNSAVGLADALSAATRQGIVTVAFNLPVIGETVSAYVGTDPVRKGRALATWLLGALGGRGNIIGLGGLPGNPYSAATWAGARAVFQGSGIEVLAYKDAYWQESRAQTVLSGLLSAYPKIDGIWSDGGQDATGACHALLAGGRPLVPVTGDDYNGLLKFYVAEHAPQPGLALGLMSEPTWQSVVALRTALTLLAGGSVAHQQIIEPGLITAANAAAFVRPGLPDAAFVDTSLDDATMRQIFA